MRRAYNNSMGFKLTKTEIIKDRVLGDIAAGRLRPGDALPPRQECMRKFLCSRSTIDKAVAELVEAGRLFCGRGSGTYVAHYRQPGKMRKAYVVGVPWLDDGSPYGALASRLAAEIQESAECRLVAPDDIKLHLGELIRPGNATIWIRPGAADMAVAQYLATARAPQLLLGRLYPRFNYITTDTAAGVGAGLAWLKGRGCSRVAFLGPDNDPALPYIAERQIAFYHQCAVLGLQVVPELVLAFGGGDPIERAAEIAGRVFAPRDGADGVFISRNDALMPLLSFAQSRGKRPGRDFHLFSFDDNRALANIPGVAMARQNWERMGRLAARWFSHDAAGLAPVEIRVPPETIVCGP